MEFLRDFEGHFKILGKNGGQNINFESKIENL